MIECRVSKEAIFDNPLSPRGNPLPFYSTLIPVLVAAAIACFVSYYVGKIPARDRVEDVGTSLMTGYESYSETAEQREFIAFVATSLVAAAIVACWLSRCSSQTHLLLGNYAIWVPLIALLGYCRSDLVPIRLVTVALMVAAITQLARFAEKLNQRSLLASWAIALTLWAASHNYGLYLLIGMTTEFATMAIVVTTILACIYWKSPSKLAQVLSIVTAAAYCVLLWMVMSKHSFVVTTVYLASSLAFLEASSPDRRMAWRTRFDRWRAYLAVARNRGWWVSFAAILLWIEIGYRVRIALLTPADLIWVSLQGAAAGWLLTIGRHEAPSLPVRLICPHLVNGITNPWTLPVAVIVAASTRGINGLWFGACLSSLCVWLVYKGRLRPKTSTTTGLILATTIAVACLPDLDHKEGFDTFHDGQILSAIWEFEQGETLYERVFPLRSNKFFLGWLSRKIFSPTYDGSVVLENFSNAACAAGACLAAFAWTRSPVWAVVIGLLVQPGGELKPGITVGRSPLCWAVSGLQVPSFGDAREGVVLLITGLACELIRRRKAQFLPLLLLGLPTFLAGFDIMAPYLAAVAAAMFCGEFDLTRPMKSAPRAVIKSIVLPSTTVLAFTTLLIFAQGQGSAIAFWQIFFDYCRHFTSFCGTPLEVDSFIYLELIGLAVFAATGISRWNRMTRRRRQMWAFLLVISSLGWFRALGRSDYGHVTGPLHLFHLLWALTAADVVRVFVKSKLGFHPHDSYNVAGILLVCLALGAGETSNPWRLVGQIQQIASERTDTIKSDPSLETRLGPQDYLWSMDYGLLNYMQKRHNPTRHAQAFCISSPNEQRKAVADLKTRPPAIAIWYWADVDAIHGPTRQYILANQVLKQFRPEGQLLEPSRHLFMVPMETDWKGFEQLPKGYGPHQELQRLPKIWGEFRWPHLTPRIVSRKPLNGWTPTEPVDAGLEFHPQWQLACEMTPREINYLLVEFAIKALPGVVIDPPRKSLWPTITFDFANQGDADPRSDSTWECPADGNVHTYLVPIGCHPGWVWSSSIRQLRIHADSGFTMTTPSVQAIEIDDLRND